MATTCATWKHCVSFSTTLTENPLSSTIVITACTLTSHSFTPSHTTSHPYTLPHTPSHTTSHTPSHPHTLPQTLPPSLPPRYLLLSRAFNTWRVWVALSKQVIKSCTPPRTCSEYNDSVQFHVRCKAYSLSRVGCI